MLVIAHSISPKNSLRVLRKCSFIILKHVPTYQFQKTGKYTLRALISHKVYFSLVIALYTLLLRIITLTFYSLFTSFTTFIFYYFVDLEMFLLVGISRVELLYLSGFSEKYSTYRYNTPQYIDTHSFSLNFKVIRA